MFLVVGAAQSAKFVDDFVARFLAEIVDARNIDQEIEAQSQLEMGGGGADDVAVKVNSPITTKFLPLSDFAGELLLQGSDGVWGRHIFDGIYGVKAGEF